jgi:uncharacterized NAD-dependent epimerase/dehydratase family protein
VTEPQRIAILAEGLFDDHHAKTAHGIIRYGERPVVAVIDAHLAGSRADDVVPFSGRPVPIVGTLEEAVRLGAQRLVVGVATTGGVLPGEWRPLLLAAIEAGLDLEAGLHTLLSDDPELRAAARRRGVELRDLRLGPKDLDLPHPLEERPEGLRVVHSVGSDCVIGKKAITLELDAAARARGLSSAFVPTGQTGIAIAGWGIAVDHVVSDFVGGAGDRLVRDGARRAELLWVEGQGALFHPAYSGVTLGLLHGCRPDALVLAHKAGARVIHNYPEVELPSLPELVAAYEAVCRPVRPTRVLGVALNTVELDETGARRAVDEAEAATGLVADDAVRFGSERLLDAVLAGLDGR